jgi:hypothetical protein
VSHANKIRLLSTRVCGPARPRWPQICLLTPLQLSLLLPARFSKGAPLLHPSYLFTSPPSLPTPSHGGQQIFSRDDDGCNSRRARFPPRLPLWTVSRFSVVQKARLTFLDSSGLAGVIRQPRLLALAACTTLGALCYGYEQGAYSQVLVMPSFTNDPAFAHIANSSSYKGWSVSLLGVGGWVGALINGCELSRRSLKSTLLTSCLSYSLYRHL